MTLRHSVCPTLAGFLRVGDEILEINGKSVANHSVDQLQKILVGLGSKEGRMILAFLGEQKSRVTTVPRSGGE